MDPITEERASRTLYRIELLRRIREQVLPHPELETRLRLCQASPELPEWWECGRHDRDLLIGASKHGVSRTDYHILNDPELSFLEAHRRFAQGKGVGTPYQHPDQPLTPAAPIKKEEEPDLPKELSIKTEDGETLAEGELEDITKEEKKPLACSPKEEVKDDLEPSIDGDAKEQPTEPELEAGDAAFMKANQEGEEPEAQEPSEVQENAEALSSEPKSLSEKGSEEEDEDKMDEDDKSEESSHAEGS